MSSLNRSSSSSLMGFVLTMLLALATVVGCDNSTDPDKDNGNPSDSIGNIPDTSSFRIVSVTGDSLYGDEEAELTAVGMGSDISRLRLFIHSLEASLLKLEDNRLTFRVPINATSGRLRLYRDDTILAIGNFDMLLYGGSILDMKPMITGYYPGYEAYAGEVIRILGSGFPMRKRDIDIRLANRPVDLVSYDSNMIEFVLPPNAKTANLTMRFFNKDLPEIYFKVLTNGRHFLETRTFSGIEAHALNLNGIMVHSFSGGDSVRGPFEGTNVFFDQQIYFDEAEVSQRGDSMIVLLNQVVNDDSALVEIHLKVEQDSNAVSGRLALRSSTMIGQKRVIREVSASVRNMRWKVASNDSYMIYSVARDMTNCLLDVDYYDNSIGDFILDVKQYDGGCQPNGSFYLTLMP